MFAKRRTNLHLRRCINYHRDAREYSGLKDESNGDTGTLEKHGRLFVLLCRTLELAFQDVERGEAY